MTVISPSNLPNGATRVFLVCPGLGSVYRGYESFTQECFNALEAEGSLDIQLFKGSGPQRKREHSVWHLPRTGRLARILGTLTGRGSYFIEQLTFVVALIPKLIAYDPEVVFFSDGNLGNFLWHFRHRTNRHFRLVFSNGGPLAPPFSRCDFVQQVSPEYMTQARSAGVPDDQQMLIPYGIEIPDSWAPPTAEERNALRRDLGLPLTRSILVCVGAINSEQKRMDYVLHEVASLPSVQRPFLAMLGAQDPLSSPLIHRLAAQLLPTTDYAIRTVPQANVSNYLRASDVFVLASLREGFGRVFLEALVNGLPCIAHDYETAHYVLGAGGHYGDLREPGALASLVRSILERPANNTADAFLARHNSVRERFGWTQIVPRYVEMLRRAASTVSVDKSFMLG